MKGCVVALALVLLAGCEARQGGAAAPGLYLGSSLGAYGASSR